MVKVTILGAGVTGMTIASQLPRDYEVTIVGELQAGDYHTKEWASPYAGAVWVGAHASSPREQKMQLEGFAGLWRLAGAHPESSVRRIEMTEIMDHGSKDQVWYAHKLPDFRFLSDEELPAGAKYGMKYKTLVITPQTFLVWMKKRLEERGVQFLRMKANALSDLKDMGHDILINATGFGAEELKDVKEQHITPWRLQCVVAKANGYDRLFIRRGPNGYYSTAFSRLDGTVYVGGVLEPNVKDLEVNEDYRAQICRRAHENQPDVFPSPHAKDWPILYDHVGIYPTMDPKITGVRCEKGYVGDQAVIHAYGQNAGGYVYSFGLARAVVGLVDQHLQQIPSSSKL
ncbi:hypothetical protein FQN52_004706 [Onygenales sp. PD_12]|nr:hypothetical protein FQN52_004706 [Onygenales sp. PD_12]